MTLVHYFYHRRTVTYGPGGSYSETREYPDRETAQRMALHEVEANGAIAHVFPEGAGPDHVYTFEED